MKIKELLAEEDYQFAQSGTSIEGDEAELTAEMDRRLKLFNYDRNGASEFTLPFKNLWTGEEGYTTGYTRHVSLVDPDYKHITGELDWTDPETIRGNIEEAKKNPENWSAPWNKQVPATVMASARIAELTQGLEDAEHYQKTVARMPELLKQTAKDKDSKDTDDVGSSIGASIGGALGSAVKGVSNAWDAGVAAFKDKTKESQELQRILDLTRH